GGEHGRRVVGGDHPADVRRELQRGMSAAGGDVAGDPAGLRVGDGEQAVEVLALCVGRVADVALRELAEALAGMRFDVVIGHGFSLAYSGYFLLSYEQSGPPPSCRVQPSSASFY